MNKTWANRLGLVGPPGVLVNASSTQASAREMMGSIGGFVLHDQRGNNRRKLLRLIFGKARDVKLVEDLVDTG